MRPTHLPTLFIVLAMSMTPYARAKEPLNALTTVDSFYKKLLNYKYLSSFPRPEMTLSKSFSAAIEENAKLCKQYADGNVCGWGADNDEYLDTQEIDPELDYKNSGIKLKEITPNTIEVKLNVYPSVDSPYYDKTIIYKMIKEHNTWVADDISYGDGRSARRAIKEENNSLVKTK